MWQGRWRTCKAGKKRDCMSAGLCCPSFGATPLHTSGQGNEHTAKFGIWHGIQIQIQIQIRMAFH